MEKQQEDLRTPHGQKLEVYVLAGASNAGKTSTLNLLAYLIDKSKVSSRLDGPMPSPLGPSGNHNDAQYCFSINLSRGAITVGISTKGDRGCDITAGFKYFDTKKCDICFIASKSFGRSINNSVAVVEHECASRGVVPIYCYLINEHCQRNQTAVEQDTAEFLHSFVK